MIMELIKVAVVQATIIHIQQHMMIVKLVVTHVKVDGFLKIVVIVIKQNVYQEQKNMTAMIAQVQEKFAKVGMIQFVILVLTIQQHVQLDGLIKNIQMLSLVVRLQKHSMYMEHVNVLLIRNLFIIVRIKDA